MNRKRLLLQMIGLTLVLLLSTACGTPQSSPLSTTPLPPTSTHTPVSPTVTDTRPPPTNTNTPVPPTSTHTPVPPTATPTATPIILPQSGEWQGQTEDGFPISFTIVTLDEVTYLTTYKILFEFICNDTKNRYTMILSEDFPLMDGQFEYRTEYTGVSGVVNAPDEIEGIFTYQIQDVCEFKNNWKASPMNSE